MDFCQIAPVSGRERREPSGVHGVSERSCGAQLVRSHALDGFPEEQDREGARRAWGGGGTDVAFPGGGTLALKSLQIELKEIHTAKSR